MTGNKIHKKLIIFDLDGTLIDSGLDLARSVNCTLEQFGLSPLPLEEIYSQVGNGVSMLIKQSLTPMMDHLYHDALKTFIRNYEKQMLDTTLPYPGVTEALQQHAGSFGFAILTNKPLYLTEKILQEFELDPYFDVKQGGDTHRNKKPEPDGIFSILELTSTDPGEAVMVGDSINDILAGRNSGVEVVGAGYGLGTHDFQDHPPDHLIHTFPELFELIHPV